MILSQSLQIIPIRDWSIWKTSDNVISLKPVAITIMGNKIWAVDMIINGVMRPMINAYVFGEFEKAAQLLYQLNAFLLGYGEGVDNLPPPKHITSDIIDRTRPATSYKNWYEKYSEAVLKKMGKYIRSVLDSLPKQFYINEEPVEETGINA